MENQNPRSGKAQCLNLDIISTLPENIIEKILTLMPVQDALRTSILSKKWQYSWRSMPKLVFTADMVKLTSNPDSTLLRKYELVNAIFHVLLFHNGPTIVEFNCSVYQLAMVSECSQIISYISRGNNVKELTFIFRDIYYYRLPISFFSLQGLERIHLEVCEFEPPLTFNGFSRLRRMSFINVVVSAKALQLFLSNCPLLDEVILGPVGNEDIDFAGVNKFTFFKLVQCVPSIKILDVSKYYMKYLAASGMPHKLPTSLVRLKCLHLELCLMEQNELSCALCLIMSAPMLEEVVFLMYDNDEEDVQQNSTRFFYHENYSDLKLDHLETLEIEMFGNLPLEMEFVKLIMAKSPVLKKARIELNDNVSADEEIKMLRDLVLLPSPRASPSAKLIIERRKTCYPDDAN